MVHIKALWRHGLFRKVPDNRPLAGVRFPRSSRSLSHFIRPQNLTSANPDVQNLIETPLLPPDTTFKNFFYFRLASAKVPVALASKSSKLSYLVMLMSSLPRLAAARLHLNTIRVIFRGSVAAHLLLLPFFSSR